MRVLVVSDSHGDFHTLNLAIKSQPSAEVIIHCGDGASEISKIKHLYREKFIIAVRGNCDLATDLPEEEFLSIDSKKVFITHGHKQQVKFSTASIYNKACTMGTDILLFGHTHEAFTDYQNGLYIMNPGSLRGMFGSFGIIDITDAGVVMNIISTNTLF